MTPTKIAQMLLDWTDPRKIVGFAETTSSSTSTNENHVAAGEVHFILADKILERLVYNQVGKDEKKVLFSMLGKVHLSPNGGCEEDLLKSILTSVTEAIDSKVAADATSKSVLNKLREQLLKMMNHIATAERGGGGVEETMFLEEKEKEKQPTTHAGDVTGVVDETTKDNIMDDFDEAAEVVEKEEEEEEHHEDTSSHQTTLLPNMDNMTLGATSLGMTLGGKPDAEGTRIMLGADEDVDMMDVDVSEEYTEVSEITER